ncbi:hypothetical protein KUM39_11465 [Streptomyces sp. J2-1]|uniref:hypothetical protein n=1 Tax=Streptomyces corallincola TaxID=2851888 RepID=UPI001C38473D|nr:hypothetical protein [Streptomyces corallincola]MBV2354975.1 hypothetical protein [Streptomyces corallincola]
MRHRVKRSIAASGALAVSALALVLGSTTPAAAEWTDTSKNSVGHFTSQAPCELNRAIRQASDSNPDAHYQCVFKSDDNVWYLVF